MQRFRRNKSGALTLAGATAALSVALTGAALAEQVLIRIEAKRDPAAAQAAAQGWAEQLGAEAGAPVVVLPLPGGWTGIALGPLERDEAAARMGALKNAKAIPADSFVSAQNMSRAEPVVIAQSADAAAAEIATEAEPVAESGAAAQATEAAVEAEAVAETEAEIAPQAPDAAEPAPVAQPEAAAEPAPAIEAEPAPAAASQPEPAEAAPATDTQSSQAEETAESEPAEAERIEAAPPEALPETGDYIRLEAKRDEAEGREALAKWRAEFPEAGLWKLDSGWYAVAIGPMGRESAQSWLAGFKSAGRIPDDAFISAQDDLGAPVDAGAAPDTSALPEPPPPPPVMPDTIEVQRALRWAGYYNGPIDGKAGKGTNDAIAAEMKAEGIEDQDPAAAMVALVERRAQWREGAGLSRVEDAASGLALDLPEAKVAFQRSEGPLVIYGPKDDSGAALVLLSRKGNSTDLSDLAGLVTALGWVPQPERHVTRDRFTLKGANAAHQSYAEATLVNGVIQGFVLIWPASDAETAHRLAIEISDSLQRIGPPQAPELPPTPEATASDAGTPDTGTPQTEDESADGVTSPSGN